MPAITDRSKKEPLLNVLRLGHGTLECIDIAKTRRFYEEVLGLEVLQTSPISLMVRKDTNHTYAAQFIFSAFSAADETVMRRMKEEVIAHL